MTSTLKQKHVYARGGHLYYRRSANGRHLVGGRQDPSLMRRDSLWLTSGGRVVKPTHGECARADFGDIELLGREELEYGVKAEVFNERWRKALKMHKTKERAREKVR